MNNKVLVIAVHPDDETIGCGGTLLKHKSNNDEINWLICTSISEEHEDYNLRQNQIDKVSKLYKFDSVHDLKLKASQVDEYPFGQLIDKISDVINIVKPNIIYLPFKHDVHSDHRKIFEASFSCTKSFRYPFIKKILCIETVSETDFAPSFKDESFVPNVFIDITDFIEEKIEILRVYEKELERHPFPRSEKNVLALATTRGAVSACEYAESFILLKEIN